MRPRFREHVLAQDDYDLDRFVFTGQILEDDLAQILSRSDLHIYLTVPFVLSWSLMDALACGCTDPRVGHGPRPRDDPPRGERPARRLRRRRRADMNRLYACSTTPEAFRPLGEAGTTIIHEQYSVEAILPRIRAFYEEVAGRSSRGGSEASASRVSS